MRASHIDVARALCIVLVVFGHSDLASHHPDFNRVLTSFRVPLFFILAGAFFAADQPWRAMLWRRTDALLKPYLAVALLCAPLYLMAYPSQTWTAYAAQVLSFNGKQLPGWLVPMWFMLLLWALHLGMPLFMRLTGFQSAHIGKRLSWLVFLLLAGYALLQLSHLPPREPGGMTWSQRGLPFNLLLWPLAAFFFLTGHLLSREIRAGSLGPGPALVSACVFAASHLLYRPSMNLLQHHYADLFVTTVSALSGSLAAIGLSCLLARVAAVRNSLAPIGRLSLYVLAFHAALLSLAKGGLAGGFFGGMPAWAQAWATFAASLAVPIAMGHFIQGWPVCRSLFEPRRRTRRGHAGDAGGAGTAASVPASSGTVAVRWRS